MIKSIYVDNFKALNDFQMDFTPFTVIVGNNMSGKSTVLQLLDFMASLAMKMQALFWREEVGRFRM